MQFRDGSELHFREFVNLALDEPRLMFAYHYQGPDKRLIFRYDNALHRPPLPKREHKHTPSGVEIAPAPKLREILDEILQAMKRDRSL
ncbi:hypothetical protein DRP77_00870 [Candidatus Poribacteria bacterium]|nr:MAG: hypothetical protein DRP77_00870 [Candidatus Poribacteria bacterium]